MSATANGGVRGRRPLFAGVKRWAVVMVGRTALNLMAILDRVLRMIFVLGLRSTRENLQYALAVFTDFKACGGQDRFRRSLARLEKTGAARGEGTLDDRKTYAHLLTNVDRGAEAEPLYRVMLEEHPKDLELLKGLGLLFLRRAEVENCSCHTGICIYPLRRPHARPE